LVSNSKLLKCRLLVSYQPIKDVKDPGASSPGSLTLRISDHDNGAMGGYDRFADVARMRL
jgi:hypothetical protein